MLERLRDGRLVGDLRRRAAPQIVDEEHEALLGREGAPKRSLV